VQRSQPVGSRNGEHASSQGNRRAPIPADDLHVGTVLYAQEPDPSPVSDTLQELPSYVARGLLYLVLAFLASGFVWAAINTIDLTTSARAILIPEGKEQVLQPSMPGVLTAIYVREGERVQQGQPLLELDAEEVGKALAEVRTTENDLALARKALYDTVPLQIRTIEQTIAHERDKLRFKQDIYQLSLDKAREKVARYEVERKNAASAYALAQKEIEVHQRLRKLGLVAEIKVLEVQRLLEEAEFRTQNVASFLRDARKEQELLERDFAVTRKQSEVLLLELAEQQQRLRREAEERHAVAALRHKQAEELAHLNLRGVSHDIVAQVARGEGAPTTRVVLRAPMDGTVAQMTARHPEEAVRRGQTLLTLIPSAAPLLAELTVQNKDMGTLRLHQPVKFKFEAFAYAEYGVMPGAIVHIAPEAQVDSTGQATYRVLATLQQTYFRVKGLQTPLLPGMTASAEIVTDQQTLLALIFRPLAEFAQTTNAAP